jgi:hypothetical protein
MLARGDPLSFKVHEQQNIVLQLRLAMQSMHQLDELFAWLASMLVYRCGVPLAQFWTAPGQEIDSDATRLLATAALDPSVPERVMANEEVKQLVERCFAEQPAPLFFPLEEAFSSYQVTRLHRYGFRYGGCAFLESTVPLSRLKAASSSEAAPTRFAVSTLLFLWQLPAPDIWTTIRVALERGLMKAADVGLTLSSAAYSAPLPQPGARQTPLAHASGSATRGAPPSTVHGPPPPQWESLPPPEELIPHRRQDPDLLLAKNPFSSAAAIADTRARRLYAAIDGNRPVSELSSCTGMPLPETYVALQMLLQHQWIGINDPGGRPLQAALFFQANGGALLAKGELEPWRAIS